MKNQRFAGLLLAAEITLGASVLLLAGCQSGKMIKKGPKPGDNVALAQGTPRPVNPAFNSGLTSPTRPTETSLTSTAGEPGSVLEPVAPISAPAPEEYIVVKGDTLSSVARSHNISVIELRNANSLTNDSLSLGQKLVIPSPNGSATSMAVEGAVPGQQYVVVKGDTLSRIAKMYGVSVADLKAANNMTGDNIHAGQKIALPAGSLSSPKWVASPKHVVKASKFTYKVEHGDTIGSIAARAHVKAQDLMDLNDISDARKLRVGATVKIPAGGKPVSSAHVAVDGKARSTNGITTKKGGSSTTTTGGSSYSGGNMLPTDIFAEPSAPVSSADTAPAPTMQPESATTGSGLENLDAAPTTPTVPVQGESNSYAQP